MLVPVWSLPRSRLTTGKDSDNLSVADPERQRHPEVRLPGCDGRRWWHPLPWIWHNGLSPRLSRHNRLRSWGKSRCVLRSRWLGWKPRNLPCIYLEYNILDSRIYFSSTCRVKQRPWSRPRRNRRRSWLFLRYWLLFPTGELLYPYPSSKTGHGACWGLDWRKHGPLLQCPHRVAKASSR